MDIQEWKDRISNAKPMIRLDLGNLKDTVNPEHTEHRLSLKEKCSKCGHETYQMVEVSFHRPQNLTIFQAVLLFGLFVMNRKPEDYGWYHKCEAGQEFIENIEKVEVL